MIYILKQKKNEEKKTPETSKHDYVAGYLYIIASGLHLHYTFCFLILLMGYPELLTYKVFAYFQTTILNY